TDDPSSRRLCALPFACPLTVTAKQGGVVKISSPGGIPCRNIVIL
ncbi:unnamed protein product, partial [Ectocarpus fasciculatus]